MTGMYARTIGCSQSRLDGVCFLCEPALPDSPFQDRGREGERDADEGMMVR